MYNYVENMVNEFPMKRSKSDIALTPYLDNLFEKGNNKILGKKTELLHTSLARLMFVTKIATLDIHQKVLVLSTRVEQTNETY